MDKSHKPEVEKTKPDITEYIMHDHHSICINFTSRHMDIIKFENICLDEQ